MKKIILFLFVIITWGPMSGFAQTDNDKFNAWILKANRGDTEAQFEVGRCYGIPKLRIKVTQKRKQIWVYAIFMAMGLLRILKKHLNCSNCQPNKGTLLHVSS